MKTKILSLVLTCLAASFSYAQSEPPQLEPILKEEILSPDVSLFQLKQYILSRAAKPPGPASLQQWASESKRLREHLLQEVAFHGWPRDWVTAPPKFEDLGVIESGKGYRMRR